MENGDSRVLLSVYNLIDTIGKGINRECRVRFETAKPCIKITAVAYKENQQLVYWKVFSIEEITDIRSESILINHFVSSANEAFR